MRIFYDFYEIALFRGKSIGIYKYALEVLKCLAKDNTISIVVACCGENSVEISQIPNVKILLVSDEYPNYLKRIQWRLFSAIYHAKKCQSDIYYSPKGFAPGMLKRRTKPYVVLTVHDMIPFHYLNEFPGFFSFLESQYIPRSLKHSIRIANKVITISNFSKEMIRVYGKREEGVHVIYNGIKAKKFNESHTIQGNYLFSITSKLPHKNKKNLLAGYVRYRQNVANPLPLKLCGIKQEELQKEYQNQGIECLGFVDDQTLDNLYANAGLFLFLPLIEGFGFPPLEALSFGTTSVVSDIPVLREILEDSVYYVDPRKPLLIAGVIEKVLNQDVKNQQCVQKSRELATKYSWENCCTQMKQVFADLV